MWEAPNYASGYSYIHWSTDSRVCATNSFQFTIFMCTYYYRGQAILLALIQHLMQNGLQNATDVILTGCSGDDRAL